MLSTRFVLCQSALLALALVSSVGCGEAEVVGNNLNCRSGSCSTTCDNADLSDSCDVNCAPGTTCSARCNAGQSCNFVCSGDAQCDFDCTAGSCNAMGSTSMCMCTGSCTGTCGGVSGGTDAGAIQDGGAAGGCIELCGDPGSPGYAACVAACP